uniref:Ribulose-bisphosphate carboxylase n=1 Tax=Romanomermis culicivorax TaxID=13658 RepID=A0A915HL80_ROMCU
MEYPIQTAIANITNDYDYKVEYIRGKDDACADFLSPKDYQEKLPTLSTKELASRIFCPQF